MLTEKSGFGVPTEIHGLEASSFIPETPALLRLNLKLNSPYWNCNVLKIGAVKVTEKETSSNYCDTHDKIILPLHIPTC